MYRATGYGYELGDMPENRPEVTGTFWEYGFGYGGEQGLGISLKGIVRGIGKGVKGIGRGIGKGVKGIGKGVGKVGKGAFKGVKAGARFVARHPAEVLAVAGGAPLAFIGGKKLIRAIKGRKKPPELPGPAIAPGREFTDAEIAAGAGSRSDPTGERARKKLAERERKIAREREKQRRKKAGLPELKPGVVEEITGEAKPSLKEIGREALETALATAGQGPGAAGGGPAGAAPGAPEEAAEEGAGVMQAGMGFGGAAMPILLASGLGLFLLSQGGGGGGRGRRRRR